jgi:hypothetical protein
MQKEKEVRRGRRRRVDRVESSIALGSGRISGTWASFFNGRDRDSSLGKEVETYASCIALVSGAFFLKHVEVLSSRRSDRDCLSAWSKYFQNARQRDEY